MSIQTKPIAEISWDDIEALGAESVEESQTLEFKSGLLYSEKTPMERRADLAKEIVAFANTYGGTIIVGVDEQGGSGATPTAAGVHHPIANVKKARRDDEASIRNKIEPPLAGLIFRELERPGHPNEGVILIRVAASQAAPHAHAFDNDVPKAYVREGASSRMMRMRDMQAVFWDARTRRERVDTIRAEHRTEFLELAREKARRQTAIASRDATKGFGAPGASVRLSAIFQSALGLNELNSNSVGQEIRPLKSSLVSDVSAAACFDGRMRLTPIAHGFFAREPVEDGDHHSQYEWKICDDGTISLTGWHAGSQPDKRNTGEDSPEHLHYPGWYALSALMFIAMARNLAKRAISPDQIFEVDMEMSLDPNAAGYIDPSGGFGHKFRPQIRHFRVGPFAISDQATAKQAFKNMERELWRAFGFETPSPPLRLRDGLQL